MTLDEAIEHTLEQANNLCGECRDEHLQLAEWLLELKEYKNCKNWTRSFDYAGNLVNQFALYRPKLK